MGVSIDYQNSLLDAAITDWLVAAGDAFQVRLKYQGVELSGNDYAPQTLAAANIAAAVDDGRGRGFVTTIAPLVWTLTAEMSFDQFELRTSDGSETVYLSDVFSSVRILPGGQNVAIDFRLPPRSDDPAVVGQKIYVANYGNDANPGTLAAPLATLEGARNKIRDIKAGTGLIEPITVLFRGGTYRRTAAFELTTEDNGSPDYPVSYEAYPGETVIISGFKTVSGTWQTHSGSIKYVDLPGQADFRSLYVGGVRCQRARWPNLGSYHTMQPYAGGEGAVSTYYWANPADLPTIAAGETVEVNILAGFNHHRTFISSIEPSGTPRKVNISPSPVKAINTRPDYGRYYLENSLSFLTEAGEFYWNNTTKRLYYWPRAGETLGTTTVEIPVVTRLMSCTGDANQIVTNNEVTWSIRMKSNFSSGDASWVKTLIDNSQFTPTTTGFRLQVQKSGANVGFPSVWFAGASYSATSSPTLTDDQWHHIAVAYNKTTGVVTIWVDGVQVGTSNVGGRNVGTEPPKLGGSYTNTFFNCEIADFIVLDKYATLTDAQNLRDKTYGSLTSQFLVHMPLAEDFEDQIGAIGSISSQVLWTANGTSGVYSAPYFTGSSIKFDGVDDYLELVGRQRPCEYVNFKDLVFEGADWTLLSEGHSTHESGYNVLESKAVYLDYAARIQFTGCELRSVGAAGLVLNFSEYITFDRGKVWNIGATGCVISGLGSTIRRADTGHNVISNSYIHDCGYISHGGSGIFSQYSAYNDFVHNEVYNCQYMGIRFYEILYGLIGPSHHNRVEWNKVHHCGRELPDVAGIYASGLQSETIIAHNFVYDMEETSLTGAPDGIYGIYLDEMCSSVHVYNNFVLRTASANLFMHQANNNLVENNKFVNAGMMEMSLQIYNSKLYGDGTRMMYPVGNKIRRNIFANSDSGLSLVQLVLQSTAYVSALGEPIGVFNDNLYSHDRFTRYIMSPVSDTVRTLAQMQADYGLDKQSVVADPLFRNAAAGDYRLKENSPAFALGFRDFDLSEAGPLP